MTVLTAMRLGAVACLCSLPAGAQDTKTAPANAPAGQQQGARTASNMIEAIEFHGMHRVSLDTLKALIHTKVGDPYDKEGLRRDFDTLWNTGRFSDIQVKREPGVRGGVIVLFVLTERS